MSQQLHEALERLRNIGDALRSTNLLRGREIHQLADDLTRLAASPATPRDTKLTFAQWQAVYEAEFGGQGMSREHMAKSAFDAAALARCEEKCKPQSRRKERQTMSDTITVNGEAYDAVPVGEGVWMVHWFTKKQQDPLEATIEATTAREAVEKAIARGSWA